MPIFSKLMFQAVRWASRRGLREEEGFSNDTKKLEAAAYWGARRNLRLLVFAKEWLRIRGTELHSARDKG